MSVDRFMPTSPEAIFAPLADPTQHLAIDGSGAVRVAKSSGEKLALGSRFEMAMRMGIPYSTTNEVVEFEQDRRIAWAPRLAGPLGRLAPSGRRGGMNLSRQVEGPRSARRGTSPGID